MRKIIFDIFILIVVVSTIIFVYQTYGEQIGVALFGEQPSTMYTEGTPIAVSIADEPAEHQHGLSGVESLKEFEGKLFIFPVEDYYGMWMKDMLISLDIIWINNDLKIVHIEENLSPDTYPETFSPDEPARFVLEVNAFFAQNTNLEVGDQITLPASSVPSDLVKILQ